MNNLIYPTINLFIYDLRNGLGQSSKEIKENRQIFESKLPEKIRESLFDFDTDLESEYTELLGNKREKKQKPIKEFDSICGIYEGYYYPVRLGDNYGLLIDCSVKSKITLYPVNYFKKIRNQINRIILGKTITIGHTWMLSASVPRFTKFKDYESIAKDCYEAFMPDGEWEKDFKGLGYFCGGQIFELWQHRLLLKDEMDSDSFKKKFQPNIQNILENNHIIIVLYPDINYSSKAAKFDGDWMRLFCYRNKILFASGLSRYYKLKLKEDFIAIQKGISDITQASSQKSELKDLRQILNDAQKTLSQYSNNVIYFDYQRRNINLNLDNYKKRLNTLQKKADSSDLKFLEKFSEHITNKDLIQLQWDYDNLSPGLKLLEGLINSITFLRSIIEIDQQQREHRFQNNIAIVGVGLGSASLVASTFTSDTSIEALRKLEIVKQVLEVSQLNEKTETVAVAIVIPTTLSIITGIFFGLTTSLLIRIIDKYWNRDVR